VLLSRTILGGVDQAKEASPRRAKATIITMGNVIRLTIRPGYARIARIVLQSAYIGLLSETHPSAKYLILLVAWGGIEPPTHGFSIRCSTN
jgi:hypothetical protein